MLLELPGAVAAAEHALDQQQGQPVLPHRRLELALGEAFLDEPIEQALARSAIVALQPVEQAGRLEVHGGHRCANGVGPSPVRTIG